MTCPSSSAASQPHGHAGRRRRRAAAAALAAGTLGAAALLATLARWGPFPEAMLETYPASRVLADRTGRPLRIWLGPGGLDCRPDYQPAPGHWIVAAIVAAEDRRFWSHRGVDPVALARAALQNLAAGRVVSGASTLTMQVIRLLEPRPRRLWAKTREARRALQLERRRDKTAILAQYLNRAPFGGNIVGIEAAAQRYFAKRPGDLSLAEAALLAGLPQSPARFRPDRHLDRARARQSYVLARMRECGLIDGRQETAALRQPLAVRPAGYPFDAPHFTDWLGPVANAPAGAPVRTTLDPDLQRRAEAVLRRHRDAHGARGGAIVILEVRTGAIRAMVGSPDFAAVPAGQVNGALAPRAAGSTLKPFVYALALERGLMTPGTVLPDMPLRFRDYDPRNFDAACRGTATVREALVQSLNLPAIEAERCVGQPLFHATLRALGFATLGRPADHYGLGLVLGNAEVRLLDLANAYACLARGGRYRHPRLIEDSAPPDPETRVFSEDTCWLLADMLSGDERALDTAGHVADTRLPRMAWKTGTSTGWRDAWAVAYNPDIVIGVWIGNPDNTASARLIGRTAAVPLAWELFRGLYPDNQGPWFARPAGVVPRAVCAASGCLPGPRCGPPAMDWAIARVSRGMPCPLHGHGAAPAAAEIAERLRRQIEPLLRPAMSLRITSPAAGSTFRLVDAWDPAAQRLPLDAAGAPPGEPLHWFVNDQPLGTAPAGTPLFWPLARGAHWIVCCTAAGASARVRIRVD